MYDSFSIKTPPANSLIINFGGDRPNCMVTIKANGTIEFGADYTPDEAAKMFWDAVGRLHPFNRRKDEDGAPQSPSRS